MKLTSPFSCVLSHLSFLFSLVLMSFSATLTAQTIPPASGDPRVDELQKQVKDLDAKMNRVLELLEGRSQVSQPGSAPSPASPAKIKKPGAVLDLWLMDGASKAVPASTAMVTLIDTTQPFGFGNCMEQPEVSAYKKKALGFRWRGLIEVQEGGQHVVVLEFRIGNQLLNSYSPITFISTQFSLDDHDLIKGDLKLSGVNSIEAKTATIDLPGKGFYRFSFWATPTGFLEGSEANYDTLSVTLKIKGPSDSAPILVDAGQICHQE